MMQIDKPRRSLREVMQGCVRGTGLSVSAPLKLPTHWSRVLRFAQPPKVRLDELFKVAALFLYSLY